MALNQYGILWHREQIDDFVIERKRYIAYASFLSDVLTLACEKYAPLAIVQTRAKTVASFAEKAIRKLPPSKRLNTFTNEIQWKEYFDPVNQFTDLCGARVITQTQQEVDRVCHFIQDNFEIDRYNSEDKRGGLRPDQFGYLSVHYIVLLGKLKNLMGVRPNRIIGQIKAEIQVRTLLQHAWANISHDNLYKHQFQVPGHWQRDMARLAAVLEAADKEFTQFVDNLDTFAGNYRAYMTQEKIDEELSILETLLNHAEKEKDKIHKKKLTLRKAQIYERMANWAKVAEILKPYKATKDPVVLKILGNAICRRYRKTASSKKYEMGQEFQKKSLDLFDSDAGTWANYAWSWEPLDKLKAQDGYAKACGIQPSEPYYLSSFLEFDIASRNSFFAKSLLEPVLMSAIRVCRSHAEVGIELPRSLFTVGRLSLLLGEPYQSLSAYIEAIDLFISSGSGIPEEAIDDELEFLHRIEPIKASLEGFQWIRMLLLISKCIRNKSKQPIESLPKVSDKKDKDMGPVVVKDTYNGPVVVLAGSCSANEGENLRYYQDLISKALAGYQGEVISGGTSNGISGIVGSLSKLLKKKERQGFTTIGYLHGSVPKDAYVNNGYDLFLNTQGSRFSPLEPLQMWLDLCASGIHSSQVKTLGVGGGKIAAIEYRLALALGAKVGVLGDSRRAVEEILKDDRWRNHPNLVTLIPDPMTIRALLLSPTTHINEDLIEKAARASHDKTIEKKRHEYIDPAMQPWLELDEKFKFSSIQQKFYAEAVLRYEGYGLRPNKKCNFEPINFSEEELERMAEMEHGRWVVERTQAGWKFGEERDPDKKISPYLAPWSDLPKKVKEWDLDYVRRWPEDFREADIEIYKLEEEN